MKDFISTTREQLEIYENDLHKDFEEFNSKLNLTRKEFCDYIDQQIEYLTRIKQEYNQQFDYLQIENSKTSQDNQQQFNKFCLSINQNENRPSIISKLFEQFQERFSMRPQMIKSIPIFHFKDIQIEYLIIKQNSSMSTILENNFSSSSPFLDQSLSNKDNNLISINKSTTLHTETSPTDQIFPSENNDQSEFDFSSSCSTISERNNILDILNKVSYQNNSNDCLMCLNEDENRILIYTFLTNQFDYFSLNSGEIISINCSFKESILNIDYWRGSGLFCFSNRNNRLVLFRLNEEKKEIEIEKDIYLIDQKDSFLNVHIYQNLIYFLYLTSSKLISFGKYHLENSTILSTIDFQNKLYDYQEKSSFEIIDFTVQNSFIYFLIQLKDNLKIFKIRVCHLENLNELHSFHLIDANKPLTIIYTEKKCQSRKSNNDVESLLYINDPANRVIHCCTHEQYFLSAKISHFGICSSNDGNLVLVTKNDIQILNLKDS